MIFEEFLAMARRETYAIPHGQRCEDGTEHMAFDLNPWRYRDRYMGQNPYGGQEMVWCGGQVVWIKNYLAEVISGICPSEEIYRCLLYTSPSPRDGLLSRMPSSA